MIAAIRPSLFASIGTLRQVDQRPLGLERMPEPRHKQPASHLPLLRRFGVARFQPGHLHVEAFA